MSLNDFKELLKLKGRNYLERPNVDVKRSKRNSIPFVNSAEPRKLLIEAKPQTYHHLPDKEQTRTN